MSANTAKRVVVTGLGIITAIGESITSFKEGLFNGKCGIGPISLFDTKDFPCQLAAQVKSKNLNSLFEPREVKRVARCDLLGLIAAREALSNSNLNLELCDRNNIAVILGGGAGGMLSWEQYRRALWLKKNKPRPSLLLPFSTSTLTDLIASHYGLTGPRATISTACSSSATS
ncbi:MAG: beta-ketoacyl-[acyl-carrier-protein] synthase family protein, partial [Deltaproteobacteria bacterium]